MTNEKTASQINYEHGAVTLAYQRMAKADNRIELIARHYLSLATLALDIVKLAETQRYTNSINTQAILESLGRTLIDAHKYDLGLELKWEDKQ